MKFSPSEARVLKADYDRDGYVALRGFLDADALQALKINLQRYIDEVAPSLPKEDVFYENKDDPSTLKQLIRMSQNDAFFADMQNQGDFRDVAEILLGRDVAPQNLQFFNKPAKIGAATPPHQDGYYWMISPMEGCTMWLALEDVDEENGCVRYARGSHREGVREHGWTETLGFSQGIQDFPTASDQASEVVMRARAGDLLIHDAMTVHWADGNSSETRSRQAMGLVYFSDRAQTDEKAREAYKKKLHTTLQAAGKI
ncbi:MAG: phytanoyl-CoA dioxygenase family protein [Synoicihabitans sp.]